MKLLVQRLSESKEDADMQGLNSTSLVQHNFLGSGSRDFFSNISSDLNGIADKTTNMFTGLFGMPTGYIDFSCILKINQYVNNISNFYKKVTKVQAPKVP